MVEDYVFCYHGTIKRDGEYIEGNGVNLTEGRFNTDFGKGFYVTNNVQQAESWARIRIRENRDDLDIHENIPVVVYFSLDIKKLLKLSGKTFDDANINWSNFILDCRIAGSKNSVFHEYDYVAGMLADGKVIALLKRVLDGTIDNNEFLRGITPFSKKSTQLSLHSEVAISCLTVMGVKEIEL